MKFLIEDYINILNKLDPKMPVIGFASKMEWQFDLSSSDIEFLSSTISREKIDEKDILDLFPDSNEFYMITL